jgi:hypothetical protein
MKELLAISPGNQALEFLANRIADDNYRGDVSSQHNRFTMDDVIKILTLFDEYAPDGQKMQIRTTDISKRPCNTHEEATYAKFCEKVKDITGIGTQDAMRKNLFVDFHRMGFINRYKRNGEKILPFKRGIVKYISITKQGLRFIKTTGIEEQFFMFSKGIDLMLGGYINTLLEIFRSHEYNIDSVSLHEYMFFVSAIHSNTAFEIDTQKCIDYISLYKTLSRGQQNAVVELLKNKMNPKTYSGNKRKRDFGNWKNKTQQLFSIITQTVYFERREYKLMPRELRNIKGEPTTMIKLSRSISEKFEYFAQHKVGKARILGFELHHVVPLSWAESREQFKLLDVWKNMVYIDAYNHAKITQNNNNNVKMDNENTTIILSDFIGNNVRLLLDINIMYLPDNLPKMLEYNTKLLTQYL